MTDAKALADLVADAAKGAQDYALGISHFKLNQLGYETLWKVAEALRNVQPKYLTGCLLDGVCRGVCRNTDCPNYDLVVAARVCVEPKEDGVVYPGGERS